MKAAPASSKSFEEWIRDFFKTKPHASVDDCVRAAKDNKRFAVNKTFISRVRLQLKSSGQLEIQPFNGIKVPPARLEVVKTPVPVFQQPREENVTTPPPEDPTAEDLQTQVEALKQENDRLSLTDRKKKFLNELVDKDPDISCNKASKALKAKFGGDLSYSYVSETIRIARQIRGLPPRQFKGDIKAPPTPPPPKPEERKARAPGRPAEERAVTWESEGKVHFQVWKLRDLKMEMFKLVARGVDPRTIRCWKPANFTMSVDIE